MPRKKNIKLVRLGGSSNKQAQNSINSAMDQAHEWVKEAIQKETSSQVAKLIKESMGTMETVNINEARKYFTSKFTEREQKIKDHYDTRSVTPLNSFYPYNPLAGSLDVTSNSQIQLENLMDNVQLSEGADAFFADGVLRSLISKQIDFVLPDRTKCTVTLDKTWKENKANLDPEFAKQFEEIPLSKQAEFNIRISRLMEKLHFWDKEIKLLVTSTLFGRNALYIQKDMTTNKKVFPEFGEPIGLTLLNPISIKKARIDNTSQDFDGFVYDWGIAKRENEPIPRDRLIPFFYDDFNIYKNTYFSGMTRMFSLVGIAHSNQMINTYDLPQATMAQYSGSNFVYVGQASQLLAKKFARSYKAGTNFHDQPALHVEAAQAAKQIVDILETRDRNYQAMSMILGIPIFILFGDSSNFATAAIAMQSYLNGTCHRLGTFFMDTLEEYFFMPLLADISNITLEELIDKKVNRVKAIKPRIDLQTKTDRFDNACKMWDRGVITDRVTFLKYVQEDELAEIAEPLDKLTETLKTEQKKAEIEDIKSGNMMAGGGNGQSIKSEGDMRMTATEAGKRLVTNFGVKQTADNLRQGG